MSKYTLMTCCILSLLLTGCHTKSIKKNISNDLAANDESVLLDVEQPNTQHVPIEPVYSNPNNRVQTDRYTSVTALPTEAQSHLLYVMISVTIPREINTIELTAHHLLRRSGYQMAVSHDEAVNQLLQKTLPDVHRKIGPMRLIDALTMLGTPAFEVVTDHVNRQIRYRLKPDYSIGMAL